jgi:hypothetical protein
LNRSVQENCSEINKKKKLSRIAMVNMPIVLLKIGGGMIVSIIGFWSVHNLGKQSIRGLNIRWMEPTKDG